MIFIAQRIRDYRYAKGWGPEELASRARISRTALYQIESGKTGVPRAATLGRIASALEVPMETLLGFDAEGLQAPALPARRSAVSSPSVALRRAQPDAPPVDSSSEVAAFHVEAIVTPHVTESRDDASGAPPSDPREGELIAKLRVVLHSPCRDQAARIVEALYEMLSVDDH